MNGRLMLSHLCLQIRLEGGAILRLEIDRGRNIEVVLEIGDMQHYRVAGFIDTKELDCSPSAVQCSLFGLNRLETKTVSLGLEVDDRRSLPCLIFFCVVLFPVRQVLAQLLENLRLKGTLGLARVHF